MVLVADEVRLTRDSLRYGFAVGKVKVLETRALDAAAFERLLDAPSFAEQKRLLSETPFGRYLETAETAGDVERGLEEALDAYYAFLDEAALPEEVVRFFRLRYDFANLKAVAKARLLGVGYGELLVGHGTIPIDRFAGELEELPPPLDEVVPELGRIAAERGAGDAAAIDTAVDRAMFATLLDTALRSRSRYLVEVARLAIDLANVKTVIRGRKAGLQAADLGSRLADGGAVPTGGLLALADLPADQLAPALARIPQLRKVPTQALLEASTLDATLDAVTAVVVRRGRMGPVGPEPVISYVLERESEVAALRVLLTGTLSGLDREVLRRYVRAVT